jgi:hypothetical protein
MQLGAIPPTEYTESYWADPRKVLTTEQVADAYHHYLEASLQRAGYIVAALFFAYSLLHWLTLGSAMRNVMTSVAIVTALTILGFTYILRTVDVDPFFTRIIASITIFLVQGNALLHLYLSQEPWQSTNLILTIVAVGFFFLTPLLYIGHLLFALAGWWLISLTARSDPAMDELWRHYEIAVLSAVVLSFIIQLILSHLVKRVAALRIRDDAQKQALQQALQSVQQSEIRLRRYAQQTEDSLRQTQTLYNVSQSITTSVGMNEVLQKVAACVASELPAHVVRITLFDMMKQQVIQFVSSEQDPTKQQKPTFVQIMDGLAGWSIRKLKPIVSPRGIADAREPSEAQRLRRERGIGSIAVAPLVYHDLPIGAIEVQKLYIDTDFTEQDADTLMTIARQVGVAIMNYLKFEKNPFQLKELYTKCEELSIRLTSKIAEVKSAKANESKEEDIKKYGQVLIEYKKIPSGQASTSFSCSDSIYANFQFKEAEDNNPIWFSIYVDGEEIKAHRSEINIDKPANLLKGKTLTGKLDYLLIPSPADIEKKPNEFSTPGSFAFDSRKLILTTLSKLTPGKHEIALYHLRNPNITNNASFTLECEDYSKSMYSQSLVKLNESGLAKVTFPTKNANPSIAPQVTKKVTQYCQESDPPCTVKLVRILSGAEEIFGEKVNGKWSKIYGKGYAVVAGIQNPDGSCDAMYGRYAREYDYSAKEFVGDLYFQSSNSEDISCKNIK